MIKVKLSALHRIYSKGYAFHILAYTILKDNAVAMEPVRGEMDTWLIVKDVVQPLINKLLERGLIYPSEVKQDEAQNDPQRA